MFPEQEVQAALERLLASAEFAQAGRLSAFLRFVVAKALAGEAEQLKEYLIGTEVFGRGPDFDPRLDPVVRVEARRLRAKLQEYYEGPGQADPVRIRLPKGRYAPAFERPVVPAQNAPEQSLPGPITDTVGKPRRNWVSIAVLVGLVAGLTGLITAYTAGHRVSASEVPVLVVPWAEQPEEQMFSDGLAEMLDAELARDARWRVVPWTRFAELRDSRGGPHNVKVGEAAQNLGAEVVLVVDVRKRETRRHIVAFITKAGQPYKQWAGEYERGITDEFSVQREVARSIAEEARHQLR